MYSTPLSIDSTVQTSLNETYKILSLCCLREYLILVRDNLILEIQTSL